MVQRRHHNHLRDQEKGNLDSHKRPTFFINDHVDILLQILRRLDGRSLGVAACVCSLWCAIARDDSLWEHLCFSHVSPSPASTVRPVVLALGGYKRLYMDCVRPLLSRLERVRKPWTLDEVQLSLSLFCVDCYERLGGGGSGVVSAESAASSSLMFLCKPVNVV